MSFPHGKNSLEDQSVTRSIHRLAAGDSDAAGLIWERFFARLVGFTRSRNSRLPAGMVDEEDIALSTFNSVCIGLRDGRFSGLKDRECLWRLLVVIAGRKSADRITFETRVKRDVNRTKSVYCSSILRNQLSNAPGPECEVEFHDLLTHLLERLCHPDLKEVALMKLEGHTNAEIAARLRRSLSTIERKLKTIRAIWDHAA